MKLTKKDFYERINGKKVVIDNIGEVQKLRNKQIKEVLNWWYAQGIFKKETKKDKFFYTIEDGTIRLYKYTKTKNRTYLVANNFVYYDRMINIHKRGKETQVKSKDIIINECYFNKKDIEVLSINTFKTCNSECIYRILD